MKKILLTVSVFVLASTLFGCSVPMPKISWQQEVEEIPTVATTISGVLFPFDVSVATKATHRLEADKKLVALVASDLVNLEIFEGRTVDLTGFSKSEGKRNVFWVHSLDLKENLDDLISDEEVFEDEYVKAKGYTFLYPKKWEMFMAPDGALYFSEKGDANRRAFFTFSVKDIAEEDAEKPRNVLIAGLKGAKEITAEEKRERQLIELFSADGSKKYVFQFNSLFEEFEKKNAFFVLLNSFVVGDDVQKVVAERQKKIADKKAEMLKKKDELSEIRSQLEALKEAEQQELAENEMDAEKKSVFDKLIDFTKKAETQKEPETETESPEKEAEVAEEKEAAPVEVKNQKDVAKFTNLIDGRAYPYQSDFLKLSLKIPYGFWYQNFGNVNGTIATIAAQKSKITTLRATNFRIELIEKVGGVSGVTEREENGKTIIEMPRPGFKNSFIRISGANAFRDAMHSVRATIK